MYPGPLNVCSCSLFGTLMAKNNKLVIPQGWLTILKVTYADWIGRINVIKSRFLVFVINHSIPSRKVYCLHYCGVMTYNVHFIEVSTKRVWL
jgi:hypothetical protein